MKTELPYGRALGDSTQLPGEKSHVVEVEPQSPLSLSKEQSIKEAAERLAIPQSVVDGVPSFMEKRG